MTPTITTIVEDEYGNTIQVIENGESRLTLPVNESDAFYYDEHEKFIKEMHDGYIWSI